MFHRGSKPLTPAEREHLEAVRRLGCICCAQFNVPWLDPVEVHHLVGASRRYGHWATIGLCPSHHRGTPFTLYQELYIPEEARVSIASGSKLFTKHYGSERELWQKAQLKLALPAEWPESTKILPRRLA